MLSWLLVGETSYKIQMVLQISYRCMQTGLSDFCVVAVSAESGVVLNNVLYELQLQFSSSSLYLDWRGATEGNLVFKRPL